MKVFSCVIAAMICLLAPAIVAQDIEAKLTGSTAGNGFTVLDNSSSKLFTVRGNGRVGINTATPVAGLHVVSNNGFLAAGAAGSGSIPASGAGVRMMWYPKKFAFRAGRVDGTQWDDASIGEASVALGLNTTASGRCATAAGLGCTASGFYSVAMGVNTSASHLGAMAIGDGTTASGSAALAMGVASTASGAYSAAIGMSTEATGYASIAMGYDTEATASGSTAMGFKTKASAKYSIAMGWSSMASGENATAIGRNTIASGVGSTAMGHYSIASGDVSTATGNYTVASGDYSTTMGSYVCTYGKTGSYMIGDASTTTTTNASSTNRFYARFNNGYIFYTKSNRSTGMYAYNGATSWSSISDSSMKEHYRAADGEAYLRRFRDLRLGSWNFKRDDQRHYGPMAQEWFTAFGHDGIGTIGDDTTLASADVDGVLCIAVQALEKRTSENIDEIASMSEDVGIVRKQLEAKNTEIARLQKEMAFMRQENTRLDTQYSELVRLVRNLQQDQDENLPRQVQLLRSEAGR